MSLDLEVVGLLGFVDSIGGVLGCCVVWLGKEIRGACRPGERLKVIFVHHSKAEQRHLLVIVKGTEDFLRQVQDVHGEAIAVGDIRAKSTANLHDVGFRDIVGGVARCNLDERVDLANRVHDE